MNIARRIGSLAFVLLSSFGSAYAADPHCKALYVPRLDEVRFQNFELTPEEEANSKADCIDQIVEILQTRRLPEIAGKPIPVRLVYGLTDDEVFPAITRILDADPARFFRLEIKFSIPMERVAPSGEPLTQIEATIRPKP